MMPAICAPYGAGATGWPPRAASRRYAAAAPRESGLVISGLAGSPVFMTGLRISCSMHKGSDAGSLIACRGRPRQVSRPQSGT